LLVSAPRRQGAPPAWWPARLYYGWALVGTLGLTATISFGILSYAFAVFIEPMTHELGWSKATVTGAFSLASLVMGVAAIPVGRWVDRHGARSVMTLGSIVATVGLVAWSRVESVVAFYVLWAMLGLAMAAVLYEPAFAVVATWFRGRRGRALTVLTFIGGFASVIFVPLATWLVTAYGWRQALVCLATLYAPLTILPHAIVLRQRPADLGLVADGGRPMPEGEPEAPVERSVAAEEAVRRRSFSWLATAFALSSLTTTAVSVHLVPLLLERGYGPTFAGAAMGLLGLMALPGRLIFTPLGSRWPRSRVTASIFVLQAFACVALLGAQATAAVWFFVVFFGAGFGAITPARAALLAEHYGPAHYGKIAGVLALVISVARAAAPVGASWIYAAGGGPGHGYTAVTVVLLALSLAAAASVLRAGDETPRDVFDGPWLSSTIGPSTPSAVVSAGSGSSRASRRAS
jgi:MFS family permease